MCDLDVHDYLFQWENVLVEWANCLGISKPHANLDQLRNGEFICQLLEQLSRKSVIDDPLSNTYLFINTHYPNVNLKCQVQLADLSDEDLMIITSLLMHYTCIYDRRECLTSPLCSKLTSNVQLGVKRFLESISNEVTNEELQKVFKLVVSKEGGCRTPRLYYKSAGDSPNAGKSPLQDFLKTPASKTKRMQEKDREINKLRMDLQSEKYEKEDLFLELNDHKEKIKKISQQLNEKTVMITKLHTELLEIENNTLPSESRDWAAIEKVLKSELKDSQNYIDLLQNEKDELQNANELIAKKLKKSEQSVCLWQNKAMTYEMEFESLTEKHREQTLELKNIRINCDELSSLLEELRAVKQSELDLSNLSEIKSPPNNTTQYEDLAGAVVEVQLLEVRKENDDLVKSLQASARKSTELEEELKIVKEDFDKFKENYAELNLTNQQLEIKILTLVESQNNLEQDNTKLLLQVGELTENNVILRNEFELLQTSLLDTKNTVIERDLLVSSLHNDINELNKKYKKLEETYNERDEQYAILSSEAKAMHKLYNETVLQYQEKDFELEAFKKEYKILDEGLEENLKKMFKLLNVNAERDLKNRLETFSSLLNSIEIRNNETKIVINNFEEKLTQSHIFTKTLEDDLQVLKHKDIVNLENLKQANEDLDASKKYACELEASVEEHLQKIKELNTTIEDLSNTINDLRGLHSVIEKKYLVVDKLDDINIKLLNKDNTFNRQFEEERLKGVVRDLEKKEHLLVIDAFEMHVNEIKSESEKKLILAQEEYIVQSNMHLDNINKLNKQIEDYEKHIESLEMDLKVCNDNFKCKCMQMEDLERLKIQIEDQYERQSCDLEKKIELLEMTSGNLNVELEKVIKEKNDLLENLSKETEKYDQLKKENSEYMLKCEDIKNEVFELNEKLNAKEKMCLDRDDIISKSNKELLILKLELQNKLEMIDELKQKAEDLHNEKKHSEGLVKSFTSRSEELERRLVHLNSELEILTELKEDLSHKNTELEKTILNIFSQLGIKTNDLNEAVESLLDYKAETVAEITKLNLQLSEANLLLEEANKEKNTISTDNEIKIKELTETLSQQIKEFDEVKAQEIENLQTICMLRNELSYTVNKYTEALQKEKDLRHDSESQIREMTESIHTMIAKYNDLDTKHVAILEELNETKSLLEEYGKEKQQLEIELVKQKKQYENDFYAAAEQYKTELDTLNLAEIKLQADIENLNSKLLKESSNKLRVESDLKKLKNDLETVLEEKNQLLQKVESLIHSNTLFEENYNELKIKHEKYLTESKSSLSQTQLKLEESITELVNEKNTYKQEIEKLKLELDLSKQNLIDTKQLHENRLKEKNNEIKMLENQIKEMENNLLKVRGEQDGLGFQIENQKGMYEKLSAEYGESNNKVDELERKISKLNCAYDILESAKQKLDKTHSELVDKFNLLHDAQSSDNKKFEAEVSNLHKKIVDYEEKITKNLHDIEMKDKRISACNSEIEAINKIVCTMKEEAQSYSDLKDRLTIIEEDNDRKIKQQISAFKHVKSKYLQLREEMRHIEQDYEKLKEELVLAAQWKQEAENTIKEKENEMEELRNKYDSLTCLLSTSDKTVASLQEELQVKVEHLENLTSEKAQLQDQVKTTIEQLQAAKRTRDETMEQHTRLLKDTEDNLLRAHDNAVDVKNDLMGRVQGLEKDLKQCQQAKETIETALQTEIKAKQFFELQLLAVTEDKNKQAQSFKKLKEAIERLDAVIKEKSVEVCEADPDLMNQLVIDAEVKLVEVFGKIRELREVVGGLERNKLEVEMKLESLQKCNIALEEEKAQLLEKYEKVHEEKMSLITEKDKETKCLDNLKVQYELKSKQDLVEAAARNEELQLKLDELKMKNLRTFNDYQDFLEQSKLVKKDIDKMINERNALESTVTALRENHIVLQIRSANITEDLHRLHFEQKQALEIIVEDINKQFVRLSKLTYNTSLNTCDIFEKTITGILSDKPVKWQILFKDLNTAEIIDKLEDLKDNVTNTLEQLETFEKSVEVLNAKGEFKTNPRVLKENVQPQKLKDDDWKKKYMTVKKRCTLIENMKNNYEKKIKQLREEKETLQNIQKHIVVEASEPSAQNETVSLLETKYKLISDEFEAYKSSVLESNSKTRKDLELIRKAYKEVLEEKSKRDSENISLKNLLDDNNSQLVNLQSTKEKYEKLFELYNKLVSENDTLKYKRSRDREEYLRLLKKEKEEVDKKIQEVKVESELKLERMKDKMIQLYKSEFEGQVQKLNTEVDKNMDLLKTIEFQNSDIRELKQKLKNSESERSILLQQLTKYRKHESGSSQESVAASKESLPTRMRRDLETSSSLSKRASTQSLGTEIVQRNIEERRIGGTLPRNLSAMDVIKEGSVCMKTSIQSVPPVNIVMEDEGDLFNNKYLMDLKQGQCNLGSGRESTSSRLSQLAQRNSMCPPHLKSSYPAETQFVHNHKFNEDDIKTGNIDLDDSMSTRLLPHEKPLKKKDVGTTSYKKPGPPTPSKNGGRLSLQGNEISREINKEVTDKTPKQRTTPNRIRSLFSRSSRDTSEVGRNFFPRKSNCSCTCHEQTVLYMECTKLVCFFCKRLVPVVGSCCFSRLLLVQLWFITRNSFFVMSILAVSGVFITNYNY